MGDSSPGKSVGVKAENRVKRRLKIEQNHPKIENFTGRTESLEDAIFDIGIPNQSDLFMQTTKKLANYAGRKLRESQDIKLRIKNVSYVTILRPTIPLNVFKGPANPTTEEKETSELNRLIFSK